MAPTVFFVNIVVIVLPIARTGIVGWINIDAVHLSGIKILKELKRVVVVGLNERVPKVATAVLNLVDGLQNRINGFAELRDGHHVLRHEFNLLAGIVSFQTDKAIAFDLKDMIRLGNL